MTLEPGDVVRGKYRVRRVLGEGGMGIVVRATHLKLDQDVALKLLKPETAANANVVERFAREAKAAARLKGEHVVRILDVEEEGGAPFIVMELLDGTDLERLVKKTGPLPPDRATAYVLEACEGLAEAHALGIVHRDVKPANLFLAKTARGGESVKLLDFGISKATDDRDPTITEADRILGSPSFMSPEQVKAARNVDARTDVWSLGVVLYYLVTGKLPFPGETATAVAARIASDPPEAIETAIPEGLREAILRCLEKDRERRFPTIAAVARALAPYTPSGERSAERVESLARMPSAPPAATSESIRIASSGTLRVTASLSEVAGRVTGSVDAPAPVSIDADRPASAPRSHAPAAASPWPRRALAAGALAIIAGVAWIVRERPAASPSQPEASSASPTNAPPPIVSAVALPIDPPDAGAAAPTAASTTSPHQRPWPAAPPSASSRPLPSASVKPVEDPLKLDLK